MPDLTYVISALFTACLGAPRNDGPLFRLEKSPLCRVEMLLTELAVGRDVRCTEENRRDAATGLEMLRRIDNVLRELEH